MKVKVRDALFEGMQGCTNHGCVVNPPAPGEMRTNGMCHCLRDMSYSDWRQVEARIKQISRFYIEVPD